ncbi:gas vesicle protein GvpO [Streptomyces huiliensis]|uniref:gas vesicle protein GvpO n=1 Tax=Streptomyces huiliensis TaxID=2876027 RepID=UPI001CC03AED|nr:gas vesicle protein GvpO [Streptomyces huiliensis]MBZ4322585.1 gas vesicle protein [Streptomyces huiliensis]
MTAKSESDDKADAKPDTKAKAETDAETETDGNDDRKDGESVTIPVPRMLRAARDQLAELAGLRPEGVSGFERTPEGWTVEIEVEEIPRVPETMSVMGLYVVTLDPEGNLTGYRRARRYERGRTDS